MKGWRFVEEPAFEHDCDVCKYLYTIVFSNASRCIKEVDVYEQCDSRGWNKGRAHTLIRYGSEGPSYMSGLDPRNLMAHAVIDQLNIWKEN